MYKDRYNSYSHRLENLTVLKTLQWMDDYYICHDEISQRMRRCIQLHEKIRLSV